jgi:hypothetical protein
VLRFVAALSKHPMTEPTGPKMNWLAWLLIGLAALVLAFLLFSPGDSPREAAEPGRPARDQKTSRQPFQNVDPQIFPRHDVAAERGPLRPDPGLNGREEK